MEIGMSLNPLVRLPPRSSNGRTFEESLTRHSLFSTRPYHQQQKQNGQSQQLVIEAKSKKGMATRQYQRKPPPPLPKLEDDGNPKFVIFIRMANVYLWYPLNIVTGGTTAKTMVAAKDNFLGKYIYQDTLAGNLAAVIYRETAVTPNDVNELPTQDELKTVFDKVKDFFGDAKESFGKMTSLNTGTESSEEDSKEDSKEENHGEIHGEKLKLTCRRLKLD